MQRTQNNTLADISFSLNWEKHGTTHGDAYYAHGVNFWQDYFPDAVKRAIIGKPEGYRTRLRLLPGDVVPDYSEDLVKRIKTSQLDMPDEFGPNTMPKTGRYYPKGIIRDICGIYRQNVTPFRFLGRMENTVIIDFNHPLSGIDLEMDLEVGLVEKNNRKYGGACVDWLDLLISGPGMQARFEDRNISLFFLPAPDLSFR